MREISPASPTIGLTAIERADERPPEESAADSRATFVGRTIRQNVRSLYGQKTIEDAAAELTVPRGIDPDLLRPQRFEAAFLDTVDKVAADLVSVSEGLGAGSAGAHATLIRIKAAMEQCRYNVAALNQV